MLWEAVPGLRGSKPERVADTGAEGAEVTGRSLAGYDCRQEVRGRSIQGFEVKKKKSEF